MTWKGTIQSFFDSFLTNYHTPIVSYSIKRTMSKLFNGTMLHCIGWGETACTIAHLFVLFPQARVETLFTVRLILHIREVFHIVVSKSLPIPIHGSRLHGPWPQCETTDKVGKGSSEQVWQKAQVGMPGWVQPQQSFATYPVKLKMIFTWRPI